MRPLLLSLFAWLLVGCQTGEFPAPIHGSTYRITQDEPSKGSEVRIDVLTTSDECANARIDDLSTCVPQVQRAQGEARLSFFLRDPTSGAPVYRALDREQVSLSHNGSVQEDFELVPHDPVSGGQLFVVMIDGSGSMYLNNNERINKVYQALSSAGVVRAFYPEDDGKTGVVLLRFAGTELTGLDGKPPRVLKNAAEYRSMVRDHLVKPKGGYTMLYKAVQYAVTDLLADKNIDAWLAIKGAEPTVVVLTDGFNNEKAGETCGDNVPRLTETLEVLKESRRGVGASSRATLYTVGLGRPYRAGKKPEGFDQTVTPTGLCGKYADYRIDPTLEEAGIDHVSLEWLAEAGGGVSFVRKDPRGLAEVLQKAAAARYRWYELRYKVPDSFHHRRAFEVKLRLQSSARAETTLTLLPSPWLDAPTGERVAGDRWTTASPYRRTTVLVMSLLGFLVLGTFVGPAWFNARRAIFRRARPRKK